LRGGLLRALSQAAHLVGYHREPATGFTRPCGLDGGVKGKQVGLLGNAVNHGQHGTDAVGFLV